jgi:hypothetical protein
MVHIILGRDLVSMIPAFFALLKDSLPWRCERLPYSTLLAFYGSNRDLQVRCHVEADPTTGPYKGPNIVNGYPDQFISSRRLQYSLRGGVIFSF